MEGKELVSAYDSSVKCTHEEADTWMTVHAAGHVAQVYRVVTIPVPDTDVAVLAVPSVTERLQNCGYCIDLEKVSHAWVQYSCT